ncbi:MAG: hypothetical protein BWK78_04850 [Thiotrichaceae bacterium IS1]|nr:MAG: hypothetical protein BWK78_04850 [Thiotrichaceae bacterium IS1]
MNETKLLYFNDNYQTNFSSKVVDVSIKKGVLIFEDTLFYPRGGNQDFDTGFVIINNDTLPIISVTKDRKTNQVMHLVSEEAWEKLASVNIDDDIRGEINWKRRYQLMKTHTSQHLLSSLFTKNLGIETIDVEISEDHGEIVLDGKLDYETLISVQQQANGLIAKQLQTQLELINGRFHVKISDVDDRECGGTHVKNLSEIGKIIIDQYKDGRLFFRVGIEAEKAERQHQIDNLKLVQIYPQGVSSLEDLAVHLNGLQEENVRQKCRIQELANELIKVELAREESINGVKMTLVHGPEFTTKEMKEIIGQQSQEKERVIICICKNNSLVVASNTTPFASDIIALCKKHDSNINGGGGTTFAQGGPWNGSIDDIRGMLTSSMP